MLNACVEVYDSSALRKNTQHTHTRLHFLTDTTVRVIVRGTTLVCSAVRVVIRGKLLVLAGKLPLLAGMRCFGSGLVYQ